MKLLKKSSLVALALILCTSSIASTNAEGSASNNRGKRIDTDILHFVYNNPYI